MASDMVYTEVWKGLLYMQKAQSRERDVGFRTVYNEGDLVVDAMMAKHKVRSFLLVVLPDRATRDLAQGS